MCHFYDNHVFLDVVRNSGYMWGLVDIRVMLGGHAVAFDLFIELEKDLVPLDLLQKHSRTHW